MEKFTISKKGYSVAEVDAYVLRTENSLDAQRERIEQLVNQLNESEKELKIFKQKQGLIAKAIMSAAEKAEQIETLTKQKYQNDMASLNAFHERWIVYYNKLIERYPLDEELIKLNNFNANMTRILTGQQTVSEKMSEAESQLSRENERLKGKGYIWLSTSSDENDDDAFNPEENIRALLRRQSLEEEQRRKRAKGKKQEDGDDEYSNEGASTISESILEEAGFDYDEALNPKQSLSEILQDLGIILDN